MTKLKLVIVLFLSLVLMTPTISLAVDESGDDRRFELRLNGGFQFESYSLGGTGVAVNVPAQLGNFYGVSARFKIPQNPIQLRTSFKSAAVERTNLTGFTPTSIRVTNQYIEFAALAKLFSESTNEGLKPLMFGLGYTIYSRKADETAPTILVSSIQQKGLSIYSSYSKGISEVIGFETDLRFDLPNSFEETSTKTGYYSSSWTGEIAFQLIYAVSNSIDFGAGVFFSKQSTSFVGTGARGTIDASESQIDYGIPFSIRAHF